MANCLPSQRWHIPGRWGCLRQPVPQLFGFQSRICLLASLQLHSGTVWRWGKTVFSCISQDRSVCSRIASAKLFSTKWQVLLSSVFGDEKQLWSERLEKEVHFCLCEWEFPVLSEAKTSSGHNSSSSKALQHMDWQAGGHCTPVTFSGVTCQ